MGGQSGWRASRPLAIWRRTRIVLAAAVLGAVSAGVTAGLAHPAQLDAGVAVAQNTTLIASDPGVPLLAPASHVPAPAVEVAAPVISVPGITVPILVYHYIRVNPVVTDHVGWDLSVTPAEFQAQMDWLHQAGGHTVTLQQLIAAMHGGPPLPSRAVVLTFDDGHDDFATRAAPVLKADGFVGISFVVSGFLGRTSYMTAAQVQHVAALGMVIGDHTVNHVDLAAMSPALARTEILACQATLQQLIGKPVLDFAYPYGDYNGTVAGIVQAAGFMDAATMNAGTFQTYPGRFLLHRTRIGGGDSVWSFAGKAGISGPPSNWTDPGPASPVQWSN